MLSKEVCKSCWKTSDGSPSWYPADDILWKKGRVHCLCVDADPKVKSGEKDNDIYSIRRIPVCCEKKLEHAIAAGKTNA